MTFLAGIWSRDNRQHTTLNNDYRIACLIQICARMQFHAQLQYQAGVRYHRPWHSIVVLPEYYFTRMRPSELTAKAMQEHVKDELVDKLRYVSLLYPNILLIPGTVAFRKSFIRPDRKKFKADGSAKPSSRLANAVNNLNHEQLNRPFDQPYKGKQHAHNPGSAEQLARLQGDLVNRGEPWTVQNYHIYKNQAYVLLGGRIMFKYNKKVGFFETQGASNEIQIHAPDMTRSNCVDLFGDKFCFEICFDHNQAVSKDADDAEKKLIAQTAKFFQQRVVDATPDVHVVVSDAVQNVAPNVVAKPGGYFIHASSSQASSGVTKVGSIMNAGVVALETIGFMGSPFTAYRVD